MSATKVLFVDLDGTLIDVFERYYQLHVDVVSEVSGTVPVERVAYLAAKRAGVSEERIVEPYLESPDIMAAYLVGRETQIEAPHYLEYDRPFPWTLPTLRRLREVCGIHLVTGRRGRRNLDTQLRALDLDQLLDTVTTAPDGDKASVIENHPAFERTHAAIVGDTELDVTTGNTLGIPAIAVACGLRDEPFLRAAGADRVIASLEDLSILIG